jgi:hypothetical protein
LGLTFLENYVDLYRSQPASAVEATTRGHSG